MIAFTAYDDWYRGGGNINPRAMRPRRQRQDLAEPGRLQRHASEVDHLEIAASALRAAVACSGENAGFAASAIGTGAIALVLGGSRGDLAVLASLAALGVTLGALVSLAITRTATLFGYSEPTLRAAVVYAAAVEVASVLVLSAFLLMRLRGVNAHPRVDWTQPA